MIYCSGSIKERTLNGFGIPSSGRALHDISNGPIFVTNLDGPHSGLGGGIGSLDDIGASSGDGIAAIGSNHDRFRADCGESIDMCSKLDFHDIFLC